MLTETFYGIPFAVAIDVDKTVFTGNVYDLSTSHISDIDK